MLLDIARSLADAEAAQEYLLAAALVIQRIVACEDVFWMSTDFAVGSFDVWRLSAQGADTSIETAMAGMFEHPAIQSYLAEPTDLTPRRLADIGRAREPADDRALDLSKQLLGPHQLSMIVSVEAAGRGRGWVLARDGRDFTAAERDVAAQILPILLALDRAYAPAGPPRARVWQPSGVNGHPDFTREQPAHGKDRAWMSLTPRERQVIDLLSRGFTAGAIGRRLGISPRTVSKHVEHAYDKLGRHDRLMIALDRRGVSTDPVG
ncbi:helix-turn-helix transcriptional regulator [Terrabacter carboxydivorans]|uniref:helix-turn-helix transcriptional regulator n=1 Tax=Terrabacter carboxydivorans TaxID=619730 RepID=UPI0031E14949